MMEIRPLEVDASPGMAEAARVRARTGRGTGGKTWWGRQWMTGIQESCPRQVMDNGRRDAKRGRIVTITVSPGVIVGESRAEDEAGEQPRLTIKPLSAEQIAAISLDLVKVAHFPADLLAGQIPVDLPELFARHDAQFMPEPPHEPGVSCGCEEIGPWCRHTASLALVLAEQLDADPFLLLALHGLDRKALMASWREAWGAPTSGDVATPSTPPVAADELPEPQPSDTVTSFYSLRRPLPQPFEPADDDPSAVIELLGFPPFFPAGDRTVMQTLDNMYDDS